MKHYKNTFFIIITASLIFITACSKNPNQIYIDEAKKLCEIYSPESLKKIRAGNFGNLTSLAEAIKKEVKSEKFLAIFHELNTVNYRNFYAVFQPRVSQLIGEPWHCMDMYNNQTEYFVSEREPKDPTEKFKTSHLRITHDGFIQINNKKYSYKETDSWSAPLNNYLTKEKPWYILIYFAEDPKKSHSYIDGKPLNKKHLENLFSDLNIESFRQQYLPYRVNEYETLKSLGLRK